MPTPRAALAEIQASASPCTASCTALLCDSQLPEVQQQHRGSQHLTWNPCAQSRASNHCMVERVQNGNACSSHVWQYAVQA